MKQRRNISAVAARIFRGNLLILCITLTPCFGLMLWTGKAWRKWMCSSLLHRFSADFMSKQKMTPESQIHLTKKLASGNWLLCLAITIVLPELQLINGY